MSGTSLRDLEINAFLAQGETLARLVSHPSWPTYIALLRDMRQAALEELACCDPAQMSHWQGIVGTLAEVMDRPARIIATAAEYQRTEEAATGGAAIRTELRAAIGLGVDREGDI